MFEINKLGSLKDSCVVIAIQNSGKYLTADMIFAYNLKLMVALKRYYMAKNPGLWLVYEMVFGEILSLVYTFCYRFEYLWKYKSRIGNEYLLLQLGVTCNRLAIWVTS